MWLLILNELHITAPEPFLFLSCLRFFLIPLTYMWCSLSALTLNSDKSFTVYLRYETIGCYLLDIPAWMIAYGIHIDGDIEAI